IPSGVGVKPFSRDVEDAYLVLEGSLTEGWEENGETVEVELGPLDLVKTPAGRKHWLRNNSAGAATVGTVIGSAKPDGVVYEAAWPAASHGSPGSAPAIASGGGRSFFFDPRRCPSLPAMSGGCWA